MMAYRRHIATPGDDVKPWSYKMDDKNNEFIADQALYSSHSAHSKGHLI